MRLSLSLSLSLCRNQPHLKSVRGRDNAGTAVHLQRKPDRWPTVQQGHLPCQVNSAAPPAGLLCFPRLSVFLRHACDLLQSFLFGNRSICQVNSAALPAVLLCFAYLSVFFVMPTTACLFGNLSIRLW